MENIGSTAPDDQTRQVSHSRYEESRLFRQMVHEIALADFEHRSGIQWRADDLLFYFETYLYDQK